MPALDWLRAYDPRSLRPDLVAGLTLAAYLLPAGIGDASLAGLAPEAGLYACLFGSLLFWCLCSARHTAISVTSAISLLIGTSLGAIGDGDPARFAAFASATALMVAAFSAGAWLLTGGAPGDSTHVLATLAYRYTFMLGRIEWGVGVFATALPVTLLFIFILIKKIR